MEHVPDASPSTLHGLFSGLASVQRGFVLSRVEAAGVEFIDENGGGPGVRLRKPSKQKR